ncbi:hypothetical protein R6Q57_008545 [Mikania cordata]
MLLSACSPYYILQTVLALCYSCCLCDESSNHVLCITSERTALLQFKTDLIDGANRLSSWSGYNKDCCKWAGVVCNNVTGHVQELHLGGSHDDGLDGECHGSSDDELNPASKQMLGGNINPSLMSLKQLNYLDLSCNDFGGISIPVFISSLQNLRYLNLSTSQFDGLIPPQLGNLTMLRVLDLRYGLFGSNFPVKNLHWLTNLQMLQHLDLSGYDLSNEHNWLEKLTSLRILHVYGNDVMNHSSVLKGVYSLGNLVSLDMSTCGLSNPILHDLENMTSLVSLDLSNNRIYEKLPTSLANLCNLKLIALQSKLLFGSVSDLLQNLCECKSSKLENLGFWGNNLIGSLPKKLGYLKNLINFDLGYNFISGQIPDSIGSLPNLRTLVLNVNLISGKIPSSIGRLSSLGWLDLSNNQLTSTLPESFGNLQKLTSLSLYNNLLNGSVTVNHFSNLTALTTLRAENNKLTLHPNDGKWVPPFRLQELRIGNWDLGPLFPSWLQFQRNLTQLDISNTNISDKMPDWFWSTFSGIEFLNTSHNRIQGNLTHDFGFLSMNAVVDLSDNDFEGPLPDPFNSPDLDFLDLSMNHLSGSLEKFLCPMIQESRQLKVLNLANNGLSGAIPDCWVNWDSLEVLNFENNRLFGRIPVKKMHQIQLLTDSLESVINKPRLDCLQTR